MNGAWQGARNILVARLDNIGDVVLLSPALRAIKENLPGARLTLFASPAGTTAAELLPEIDEVLTWRVVWQDVGNRMPFDPEREERMVERLREEAFDAAIIFTSFSQTPYGVAYACYLAGIPIRLGQSKEFGGSLLSIVVQAPTDAMHQAERNLHLLEAAGFVVGSRDLRLRLRPETRALAAGKLERRGWAAGTPYALIHPAASCTARSYPPERFPAVADGIIDELGLPVVLVGAERERGMIERIAGGMRREAIVLAGETTVPEWAALIEGARLLISNNTGAMHLADAFGTPSVITYSGTDLVSQWAPRHSPTRILHRPTPCSPCYGFTCPYHMECLDVPAAEVVLAAREVLGRAAEEGLNVRSEGV